MNQCRCNLKLWNIEDSSRCNSCNQVDTLCHYFAECSLVCDFWKYLKTWFLRAFEFCINSTALDVLLGITNYCKNKDIDILNFVILFAKSYIYDCKKKEMPIDLYNFQVKLKTHMVIQEYRCKVYNKTEELKVSGHCLQIVCNCASILGICIDCHIFQLLYNKYYFCNIYKLMSKPSLMVIPSLMFMWLFVECACE